jgi:GTP pyrophosphokinase
VTITDLVERVRAYTPTAPVEVIQRAYDFSARGPQGQRAARASRTCTHPLQVASIIADMRLDVPSVATGLLHDTVEDTLATLSQIEENFGSEIAGLVDGVTKIGQINFTSREEKQAENFRKMLLAMARDIRVILVKLADRTHNMRTLGHLPPERQADIAQETLDIYAPLAHRLGVYWIKSDLEDNALRFLHPEVYYQLKRSVAKRKAEREKYIKEVISVLEEARRGGARGGGERPPEALLLDLPEDAGAEPALRPDLRPRRVPRRRRLGRRVLRGARRRARELEAVPGRFKDYIALPKANGYQSLHTTVIGPYGERMEIQIRTREMHRVAEYGVAAHWRYKKPGRARPTTAALRVAPPDARVAAAAAGPAGVPALREGGPLHRGRSSSSPEGRPPELPGRRHRHRLRVPHPLRGRASLRGRRA